MLTGDAIATVATPFARMVGADCIDPQTNELRPESPCAKAKQRLNNGENLFAVLYDRFFSRTKGEKVKFLLQIEVEAEDLKSAVLSDLNKAAIIAAHPRPTPPQSLQNAPQRVLPAIARPTTGTPHASA